MSKGLSWDQVKLARKHRKAKKQIANLELRAKHLTTRCNDLYKKLCVANGEAAQYRRRVMELENVLMAYGFVRSKDTGWIHTTWRREVEWPEPHQGPDEVVRMPIYFDQPSTRARLGLRKADDGS